MRRSCLPPSLSPSRSPSGVLTLSDSSCLPTHTLYIPQRIFQVAAGGVALIFSGFLGENPSRVQYSICHTLHLMFYIYTMVYIISNAPRNPKPAYACMYTRMYIGLHAHTRTHTHTHTYMYVCVYIHTRNIAGQRTMHRGTCGRGTGQLGGT